MTVDHDRISPLAIAFQEGDQEAFGSLVDELQELFYRIAYRVVGNPDVALDVVQDAFVKIHANVASWDRRSRFFSWSYRVVTNMAIDALRKKSREKKAWENRALITAEYAEDMSSAGLLEQERAQLVGRVKEAIEALPPGQRAIVSMRHYEGFSLKEIAEVRGCALGTVKSTLHQAFRSLRRSLGRELLEQFAGEAA